MIKRKESIVNEVQFSGGGDSSKKSEITYRL